MADTHTAVRLSALETLGQLEPFDLAEIAPRASPLIDEANPLIVASALELFARLAPEDLAPYADQINCCRFDQAADVRAAAVDEHAQVAIVEKLVVVWFRIPLVSAFADLVARVEVEAAVGRSRGVEDRRGRSRIAR